MKRSCWTTSKMRRSTKAAGEGKSLFSAGFERGGLNVLDSPSHFALQTERHKKKWRELGEVN